MLLEALKPMAEMKARYEFRIWAQNLAGLRDKLQQAATPSHTEPSHETYLISATTDRCNAKIRNDLLDIKVLIGNDRGFEQWKPVLKAGFPLERPVIEAQIFPALEVILLRLEREQYSMAEFLDEVAGAHPKIKVVAVSKTRLQFNLDGCQAEFASTTIDGVAMDTVAAESADPDAVARAIRRLGIEGLSNTSYIRQIKQMLER
jgi:exopolyphosphatase / guanosine-5'-triphosphate,3'-diphosphate pyrophosphatase